MDPTLRSAAVEESGVIVREQRQTHGDRENDDGRVTVTLYVTVHAEDGGSNVVPLSFSSADNVLKVRPINITKILSGVRNQYNLIICRTAVVGIVAMKAACALLCHPLKTSIHSLVLYSKRCIQQHAAGLQMRVYLGPVSIHVAQEGTVLPLSACLSVCCEYFSIRRGTHSSFRAVG